MKCPSCTTSTLAITERQGIEIDYCPDCRGVWLDRGELDKLIDRAAAAEAPAVRDERPSEPRRDEPRREERRPERYDDDDDDDRYRGGSGYKKSKKKSLLGEIFDFG